MTPEQQQRIEQIRERVKCLERAEKDPHVKSWDGAYYGDVHFLLSLVKSQEKPDCWPDMAAVNREYHYTVMRSACVAKLRQIAADYDNVAQPNTGAAISKQALLYGARQLESVSIEASATEKGEMNG